MGGFGWQELLIILGILLLLFGATRLPSLARSMGSSVRGFKKGLNEGEDGEGEGEAEAEPAKKVEAKAKAEPAKKDDPAAKDA